MPAPATTGFPKVSNRRQSGPPLRFTGYVDLTGEMADAMDRRDAACVDARNTVEHRTIAEVMRSNGASEERIVSFFGYSLSRSTLKRGRRRSGRTCGTADAT